MSSQPRTDQGKHCHLLACNFANFSSLFEQLLVDWNPRYTKIYLPGDRGYYFQMCKCWNLKTNFSHKYFDVFTKSSTVSLKTASSSENQN